MPDEPVAGLGFTDEYTNDFEVVRQAEDRYLKARREACGLTPPAFDRTQLWGLCFSGGGIRSATFGLGVLQALVTARVAKRFDFMSTVSGGGYLGACVSSLLSWDRDLHPNGMNTSLDPEGCPFVGYRLDEANKQDPLHEVLSVRTQMHHLRTHGEYLAPHRRGWLSGDMQRAVGSVVAGVAHHFGLATLLLVAGVAGMHLLLDHLDPGLGLLHPPGLEGGLEGSLEGKVESTAEILGPWCRQRVATPVASLADVAWGQTGVLFRPAAAGVVFTLLAAALAIVLNRCARPADAVGRAPRARARAGWTTLQTSEADFIRWLNGSSVVVALLLMIEHGNRYAGDLAASRAGLFLPFAFACSSVLTGLVCVHAIETFGRDDSARRSRLRALQGATFYGLALSTLLPIGVFALVALAGLPWGKLVIAAASLLATSLLKDRTLPAAAGQGKAEKPFLSGASLDGVLDGLVALAVLLGVSFVSDRLLGLYEEFPAASIQTCALAVAVASAAAFVALGFLVDANRVSPHYFYRDRLSQAYLETFASARRASDGVHQGLALKRVRDSRTLKLKDLGAGNGRGPYHLIVTALNLTGSDELKRKTLLSDHFVFSRDYIGSGITGWARTASYRGGETKLARAMTISGAAVASAAGPYSSAWWSFVLTLFNTRLGYWMLNPWAFGQGRARERRLHFWPGYLMREMLRRTHAREDLVNLSDGGHTGDNLGLMPLLERRCRLILVCDAEQDPAYGFASFVNAVRMANVEQNLRIEIPELDLVVPAPAGPDGLRLSPRSVVCGRIHYDDGSEGQLVYVKASLPPGLPADVAGYARSHPRFPHQSTVDQFFDDAQFESYRALGAVIGAEAVRQLSRLQPVLDAA